MFSSFYWLSFFLFISSGLGFLIFWGDAHLHSALSSTKSSALILPSPPYCFFFRLMPAADRGEVWKGILSLSSFTFSLSLSFAASDLIWLVHKSPQGLSWVACGQPELKLRVGLLPQFHWKCLWMAAVLCAVFGVANLEGSPHTLSKVKCYQESKSKKHLASQQINGLVCHVQWQFWKTTQNPEELLFSNFSQNKTYKMAPRFSNNYLGWSLSTCAGKPLLLKRPKCNRNADTSVLIISMLLT